MHSASVAGWDNNEAVTLWYQQYVGHVSKSLCQFATMLANSLFIRASHTSSVMQQQEYATGALLVDRNSRNLPQGLLMTFLTL